MRRSKSSFYRKRLEVAKKFWDELENSSNEDSSSEEISRSFSCNDKNSNILTQLTSEQASTLSNESSAEEYASDNVYLQYDETIDVPSLNMDSVSYTPACSGTIDASNDDAIPATVTFSSDISDSSLSPDCVYSDTYVLSSGSDYRSDKIVDEKTNIAKFLWSLKLWFIKFNITMAALGGLLKLLLTVIPGLPKDPRTVIKHTKSNAVEVMAGGEYFHFGLKDQILKAISKVPPPSECIELLLHHDGIPLSKSGGISYYPILCSLRHTMKVIPPFVVTIFCGKDKPPLKKYLKDFAPELHELLQEGISDGKRHYNIEVHCFICDAPAKAFIKGIVGHSGYYGCDNCEQKGRYKGRMTFPETNSKLRTDESFFLHSQSEHHNERSPLTDTGLRMVSCFPLDYLHLILLGIMRTLMYAWFDKQNKKKKEVKPKFIKLINDRLFKIAKIWPSDFSRKPRSTDDIRRWKATEFRQILLYIGPSAFKSYISSEAFKIFMKLHAALTILCRPDLVYKMNDVAQGFIDDFVKLCKREFGTEILHYNFHNILHLTDHARVFGHLDSFSSFPFESYLGVLKRLTQSTKSPLKMLVKKLLCEEDVHYIAGRAKESKEDGPVSSSLYYPESCATVRGKFYKKFYWHGTLLSSRMGDNCVTLKNGKVVMIEKFLCTHTQTFIIGKAFAFYEDAYTDPLPSSDLGISLVRNLNKSSKQILVSDILWKAALVPYKDKKDCFVSFPIRD